MRNPSACERAHDNSSRDSNTYESFTFFVGDDDSIIRLLLTEKSSFLENQQNLILVGLNPVRPKDETTCMNSAVDAK